MEWTLKRQTQALFFCPTLDKLVASSEELCEQHLLCRRRRVSIKWIIFSPPVPFETIDSASVTMEPTNKLKKLLLLSLPILLITMIEASNGQSTYASLQNIYDEMMKGYNRNLRPGT